MSPIFHSYLFPKILLKTCLLRLEAMQLSPLSDKIPASIKMTALKDTIQVKTASNEFILPYLQYLTHFIIEPSNLYHMTRLHSKIGHSRLLGKRHNKQKLVEEEMKEVFWIIQEFQNYMNSIQKFVKRRIKMAKMKSLSNQAKKMTIRANIKSSMRIKNCLLDFERKREQFWRIEKKMALISIYL